MKSWNIFILSSLQILTEISEVKIRQKELHELIICVKVLINYWQIMWNSSKLYKECEMKQETFKKKKETFNLYSYIIKNNVNVEISDVLRELIL